MTQRSSRSGAVTLRQVAAHAAVSRQTVSNALNAPHRLDPATLAKVNQAIEELRYRPNRSARSLSTGSAGLIGYCMVGRPEGTVNAFMDSFLHALCGTVETAGRHVLLFTAPAGEAGMSVYADLVAQQAVDAFVLSETERDDPRHRWLADRGIRFVSFGRTWQRQGQQPGSWVDVDGATACAALVDGLHALGHTRIAFVGWRGRLGATEDRLQGWREACRRHGLRAERLLVRSTGDTVADGELAAHELLDRPDPPTAIMAVCDVLALGVLRAVTKRGYRAGADVAITGFDDSPLAAAVAPGLTTVRQPIAEVADTLLRLLEAPNGHTEGVLLPGTVISRASAPVAIASRTDDGF
jgi:DNA-binding LacI/PurR family transcriptional regulator